jgi:hypothetical protein
MRTAIAVKLQPVHARHPTHPIELHWVVLGHDAHHPNPTSDRIGYATGRGFVNEANRAGD